MIDWSLIQLAKLAPEEGWLSPSERAHLGGLTFAKRRRDYLLGRAVSKMLYLSVARAEGLAVPRPLEVTVGNDPDGAPYLALGSGRVGRSLSISHRQGHGLACLGPPDPHICVGGDVEAVEPRSPAFVKHLFSEGERALARWGGQDLLWAQAWTVKEAVLKALRLGLLPESLKGVELLEAPGPCPAWRPVQVTVHLELTVPLRVWVRSQDGLALAIARLGPGEGGIGDRRTESPSTSLGDRIVCSSG